MQNDKAIYDDQKRDGLYQHNAVAEFGFKSQESAPFSVRQYLFIFQMATDHLLRISSWGFRADRSDQRERT